MMLWTLLVLLPFVLGRTSSYSTDSAGNSTTFSTTTFTIPVEVSTTTTASTNTTISTAPASETGFIVPTIAPFSFTPFPTPSQAPVPGVFINTDPSHPPTIGSEVQSIPDFGPAWAAAHTKAKEKIATFSIEEKVNVTTGIGYGVGRCVGNIPQIQDWPGLCLEDSPLGVRSVDFVTVFPAAINVAATFNPSLMRARGLAMGREHRGKGVNIALGPMMNMGRIPNGGRNWEGFGADPFLTGIGSYETILGMQQAGVQACAKHFINNEQEHSRMVESSNVDDRTQHEIYAYPFLKSVMAGVASVMCSYNLVNDTYACENDKTMNGILKGEFGFQGFIMSDWGAQHSTMSAVTGLDMTMPGTISLDPSDGSYFGANLTAFVQNNTIPLARLDDMATRIIAAWYFVHQDSPSYPVVNFNAFEPDDEATNEHIDVQADHDKLVRQIGAASTVLLKNVNGALPLKKPKSIVLVGSDAGPPIVGPNEFNIGLGDPSGTLAVGWGSGVANFTYLISPLEAIQARARQDRTSVSWMLENYDLARAGNVVIGKSVAIVFVNSDSGELFTVDGNAGDRNNLTAWHQGDQLIQAVAAFNNNTIVVTHSVGPLILEPWIEHPNVTAVLWAGLPGTESGNALTDVLYGKVNPSGRLPYTIAKQSSDYPAQVVVAVDSDEIISIPYVEGLMIDYRHFDAMNITPRFEFGYGLSYTTFKYSNLDISKITSQDNDQMDLEDNWAAGMPTPQGEGSSAALWLHRPVYQVIFDIQNTGAVAGAESPQIYLNMPASSGEPPSILRGFTNLEILPNERKVVMITLSRFDLSIWDVVHQGYRKPAGTIKVTVGASSRDVRLRGKIPE